MRHSSWKKRTQIRLADTRFRISSGDRKLRHTAAERAHVRIALEEQRPAITLETRDRNRALDRHSSSSTI